MEDQIFQVGDKEYNLEELQELVDKGQYAKEMESTYSTDFKSAWSAYGKAQNENKRLQTELEELRTKAPVETPQPQTQQNDDWRTEIEKRGFISKDEAATLAREEAEKALSYREEVQQLANQFKQLDKEIDGTDGRPKFESPKVLAYMEEHRIINPVEAYERLNHKDLVHWEAQQLAKKPDFAQVSGQSTAAKSPTPMRFNRDNIDTALREALAESKGKF